jgi:hypothetical protein
MNRKLRSFRAALVCTTAAFCLVSSLLVAACGFRVTAPDFPVLKLTSTTEPETPAAPAPAE